MKKIFSMILVCCLLLPVLCMSASAATVEEETYVPFLDVVITEGSYEGDLADLRYYPFVYSEDDGFAWFRDVVIGPNDCEEGYLYVKDQYKEEIWKVIEQPVSMIRETDDIIYCIADENTIVQVDYFGNNCTTLYESNYVLDNLELLDNTLYFIEEENVTAIDPATQSTTILSHCDGITGFYLDDENTFCWQNESGDIYDHSITANTDTLVEPVTDEHAEEHNCDTEALMESIVDMPAVVSAPVSLPLSAYPAGSYFTYSGGPCGHHGTGTCDYYGGCNCRAYSGSIQCMGFARYASDQYAHKSSWSAAAGDTRDYIQSLQTVSNARNYFAALSKGAYVRLNYTNDENGKHSIVLLSTGSSAISTYECNNGGGDCHVSVESRSLSSFTGSNFKYAIYSVSHHFSGSAVKYSSAYHKKPCTSSGCTGYLLQAHYSSSPGSNATCSACGYVGKIDMGVLGNSQITGVEEYLSIHNEVIQ